MKIDLTGKRAVVTGSTRGIGYGIAAALAESGARVLITGRGEDSVSQAQARLAAELPSASVHGVVDGVAADLGSAEGAAKIAAYWPEADILVNNVGLYGPQRFFDITDADWERYFQVNVMAAVRLSRHYAAGMVERGWGRVLFSAATVSGFMNGEMAHFAGTKAALLGISRGLAEELAGTGVTANAFLPGPTRTEGTDRHMQSEARRTGTTQARFEAEMFDTALPTSLVGRFITPAEVAALVVFLASEQASAITGTALRVDGGILRSLL